MERKAQIMTIVGLVLFGWIMMWETALSPGDSWIEPLAFGMLTVSNLITLITLGGSE